MRLRKDVWECISLGNIFKLQSGNALPVSKHQKGVVPVYGGNGIIGYHNKVLVAESTIAIGRVGTPGSIYITNPNCWITDNALYPRIFIKEVDLYFLAIMLESLNLSRLAQKTAQPSISQSIIYNVKVNLPPLDQQKQIASLFQSIETALEQIETQEKYIESLQKTLINGLLERTPNFGNLLKDNNLIKMKFRGMADCIEKHDKEKKDVTRFVGLENIESGNFRIENWGNIADGTTFTKRFTSGDVLFGKRRSYLKKVAVADFDGICSGDILVFRAKKEAILPEILPYYVASEAFTQHAVTTSAGSLSPRTKWKDLQEFEFILPDLKTQGVVLHVLNQVHMSSLQLKDQKKRLKTLKRNLLNEILG